MDVIQCQPQHVDVIQGHKDQSEKWPHLFKICQALDRGQAPNPPVTGRCDFDHSQSGSGSATGSTFGSPGVLPE